MTTFGPGWWQKDEYRVELESVYGEEFVRTTWPELYYVELTKADLGAIGGTVRALNAKDAGDKITMRDVQGSSRKHRVVERRREIARKLRARGLSLPQIGRYLGGRHHTTIMSLLKNT